MSKLLIISFSMVLRLTVETKVTGYLFIWPVSMVISMLLKCLLLKVVTSIQEHTLAVLHFILHHGKGILQLLIILSKMVLMLIVEARMIGCLFILAAFMVI